jgi:hypothetical protein
MVKVEELSEELRSLLLQRVAKRIYLVSHVWSEEKRE